MPDLLPSDYGTTTILLLRSAAICCASALASSSRVIPAEISSLWEWAPRGVTSEIL